MGRETLAIGALSSQSRGRHVRFSRLRSPRGGGRANRTTGPRAASAGKGGSRLSGRRRRTRSTWLGLAARSTMRGGLRRWPRSSSRPTWPVTTRARSPASAATRRAGRPPRRPIAQAVDRDGTFLDIGCASGHLLESLLGWTPHRIDPYGLDLAPGLVELARRRLAHRADRIFVGNVITWEP